MLSIFDLKQQQREALAAAETCLGTDDHVMSTEESANYEKHMAKYEECGRSIAAREKVNTIRQFSPVAMLDGSLVRRDGTAAPGELPAGVLTRQPHVKETALRANFGAWARRIAGTLTGLEIQPAMEASAPSGVISVGTGTNLDSIGFAIPLEVLPFLPSYLQFAPFELVGSRIIATTHMRNVNLPVLSAGAAPTAYAEGSGPTEGAAGSQPMGLSGFQFGAQKFMRSVLATWESLQSSESPLEPMILDELATSLANIITSTCTQKLYAALTAPPNYTIPTGGNPPLQIVGGGSTNVQNDVYGLLQALRHSLPDGLEEPTNSFMLSRATLASVKNVRASTSGVPMFDAEAQTIFGRPFRTNEYFDSVFGAGAVVYGNWNKGCFLRKCPTIVRPLLERYWTEATIGFVGATWMDAHFLAELVGATNPPTWQPLNYAVLPSGSLE